MELVLTIITSVVSAMLVFILQSVIKENRRLKKEKDDDTKEREKALETGVRQLLCVRLEEIYDQYSNNECIPRRSYDRWMKLHAAYKGLHGNGTFNHMKEELDEKHIVG